MDYDDVQALLKKITSASDVLVALGELQSALFPQGQAVEDERTLDDMPTPTISVIARVMNYLAGQEKELARLYRYVNPSSFGFRPGADVDRCLTHDIPRFEAEVAALRSIPWKEFIRGHRDQAYLLRDLLAEPAAFATVPSWQREEFLVWALDNAAPGLRITAWVKTARTVGMDRRFIGALLMKRVERTQRLATHHDLVKAYHPELRDCGYYDGAHILFEGAGSLVGVDVRVLDSSHIGYHLERVEWLDDSLVPWGQLDNAELLRLFDAWIPTHAGSIIERFKDLTHRFGIEAARELLVKALQYNPTFEHIGDETLRVVYALPLEVRVGHVFRLTADGQYRQGHRRDFIRATLREVAESWGENVAAMLLDQILGWSRMDDERCAVKLPAPEFYVGFWKLYKGQLPVWLKQRLNAMLDVQHYAIGTVRKQRHPKKPENQYVVSLGRSLYVHQSSGSSTHYYPGDGDLVIVSTRRRQPLATYPDHDVYLDSFQPIETVPR